MTPRQKFIFLRLNLSKNEIITFLKNWNVENYPYFLMWNTKMLYLYCS